MKATLLQTDIVWANPQKNLTHIEQLMEHIPQTDLIVLPEMFSTGFATQPKGIAESNGLSLKWMQQQAAKRNCAFAGSIATEDNGKFYNRFYFVKPDGSYSAYDKHHLFTYGGEDKQFTAGDERIIVEYQGFRILLQICYDLRFPVYSRNRKNYDVAIYVASWPTVRLDAWTALLKARAIENQCYVLGVDRTGDDPNCSYSGGTMAFDAYGKLMAECERDMECHVTVNLDMDTLKAFRKKFPVLNDRDLI